MVTPLPARNSVVAGGLHLAHLPAHVHVAAAGVAAEALALNPDDGASSVAALPLAVRLRFTLMKFQPSLGRAVMVATASHSSPSMLTSNVPPIMRVTLLYLWVRHVCASGV